MRLLIVGLNYAPEPVGIGPYTKGLAEWLAARGHEVEVVAGQPYYPQWQRYPGYRRGWLRTSESGVSVTRCPHYVPRTPTGARRVAHHASFAASASASASAAALRFRPEVVIAIAPSIMSAYPAWLAARLAGAKLWLHVQDFETDAAFATGLIGGDRLAAMLLAAERGVLRAADTVSTIGPAMVTRLIAKGVASDRTFELRNWATLPSGVADGSPYRGEWGLTGKTVALFSGTLNRKADVQLIAMAARLMRERDDIALVICGEGPEREALADASRGLPNFQLHPLQPAERLADLMAFSDVHLLTQDDAAADLVLPSKLTNMLASGRPVVATAQPGTGLHEEIEGCGIAVPPGDAAALAGAILRLTDDPALAARLGAAAGRRAAERWSKDAILSRFEQRLSALAARPTQP